jgi:DNA polymerase-1
MARIKEINLPINANSYQQVRPYINSNQSDGLGLALLTIQGNEKAKAVQETRKLIKNNSFLTKFTTTAKDDCIFGKFKVSARSGRTTSDDQNLQQIPRNLKGIFGVDTDSDIVLIYSDFAQIQLRGVCVVTGDTTMERLFREGKDLHSYVAEIIFGKDFTPKHRQIAKTANFGLLFGAGVVTFQSILIEEAGIYLTDEECMAIKKKWLGLFRQIENWQKDGYRAHAKKIAWETPLGRKYTARLGTDQLAMQIQGFEAEVAKLAYHYMKPKLEELSAQIKLRVFIHDSYIFSCPKDPELYKKASTIIAECMQEAWKEMCQSVKISNLPMPTKVRVGYNWGDIESDNFIHEEVKS